MEAFRDRRTGALLMLVAAALLWSTGGFLIKSVSWHPMAIAGMRGVIAGLLVLVVLRRPQFTWSAAQIGGGIAYAATVILFVLANKLTTAANAILLQFTAPIYVAIFGPWFVGERTTKFDWCIVLTVFLGIGLFFCDSLDAGGLVGNILAVASGVTFAWIALFVRKQKKGSTLESLLIGNVLAALIGLPFMFTSMPDAKSWACLILLGVFQLGLAYILFVTAIKRVRALDSILITVLEPLLNPVWVFLLLGERPGKWALVGGGIVIVAVTVRGVIIARQDREAALLRQQLPAPSEKPPDEPLPHSDAVRNP